MPISSFMYLVAVLFTLGFANTEESSRNSFTVPLSKQEVPVTVKGRVVAHKTAYFGEIFVGWPRVQTFTVVFDTGSGHLFLPSSACQDESCVAHRRYDRSLSDSAIDVNHDGGEIKSSDAMRDQVSIAYGTGEIVGEFIQETVCAGFLNNVDPEVVSNRSRVEPTNCARVRVITAREMTPEPFKNFVFDGVLGLGLESLALDPEFHFIGQVTRSGHSIAPIFGVFIAPRQKAGGPEPERSEIRFGEHDEKRVAQPLSWLAVQNPELGYWRIPIKGLRVGDKRVSFCDDGTCSTILDTGTSMLGVPRDSMQDLMWLSARAAPLVPDESTEDGDAQPLDCRDVPGPPLVFEMEGGVEVTLEADDYSRPAPQLVGGETLCRSSLLPIDMPTIGPKVFIWGEPVLRKYYTVYDSHEPPRVGFAPSVAALTPSSSSTADKTAITIV